MYKALSPIAAALILASCSSSEPDAADIEKNIAKLFVECPQISVEETEKTNGIKESEITYTIDAKFTLKNTPSSENEELFEIYTEASSKEKNLEQELETKRKEFYKSLENLNKFSPEMEESSEYKEKENAFNKEKEEVINLEKEFKNNMNKANESKGNLEKNFRSNCPITSSFGNKLLFELFTPIKGFSVKDEKENIGKEFSKEFTAKLKMIKTDNGWMIEELAR